MPEKIRERSAERGKTRIDEIRKQEFFFNFDYLVFFIITNLHLP